MELDLDSFLQSQTSTDDEEEENNNTRHYRTIDEILNDSDTDSDPSPASSPSSSNPKPFSNPEKPSQDSKFTTNSTISSTPISSESAISSRKAFLLGRNALFGGVRVNPKPGAALAAAAAASRSIPTPHAAAIKWRRANSDATLDKSVQGEVLDSSVESFEYGISKLDSKVDELDQKVEFFETPIEEFGVVSEHVNEEHLEQEFRDTEAGKQETEASLVDGVELGTEEDSKVSIFLVEEQTTLYHGIDNDENVDERYNSSNDVIEDNAEAIDASGNVDESNLSLMSSASLDENHVLPEYGEDVEVVMELDRNNDGEVSVSNDETGLTSEVNEVVEDRVVEFGVKKGKKSGKKSHSSMKPLELAEELEKKHAYSGLHWEEGAAAQPMKLEGIRRGPPAVGYLDINTDNAITRTISSPAFKREHGSPKVLAVHGNFIAVGMSKGLTLVVPSKYSAQNADKMEAKMLLLAPQSDRSHFPVTSMCFNQQGDLLLAGYGNGHVIVWDMQRAAPAKVITGEHTAPVVHTLFLGRQFKAVTGDCKGLALLHTFSIGLLLNRLSVKTQCLLDGQKTGILLSASPLLMEDSGILTAAPGSVGTSSGGIGSMMGGVVGGSLFNEGSSPVDEGVVVFATHHNALVARLSPNLEVYAQFSKPDGVRDGSMPCTAWKSTPLSQGSSTEPTAGETSDRASFLVIAWDRKVQVSKLVKSELKVYKEWTLDSAAIGVAWLDDQMLAILTVRRQFCLFSKEGNELHRTNFPLDISGADDFIVYHTYFSNLFGNPEKAYHNCLAVRGATIYVLGPMHLLVSRLLPWKERIQVLRTAGDWMGALDMAMRLYDGHAHGVIDLPRTLDAIREAIMAYLVELILSYVDEVFSYISVASCNQIEREGQGQKPESETNSVHSEMEDQFARVGGVAVEFCVHVKRVDVLFDDIFSKFLAVQHGGTFLELLEPYILKDMLGCLPPEIMQALVEHYSSKGWLQRVEQCVLHMDISSLDFNQVVRLCREHGLHGALIYLFNKGLDDFKAPLEELLLVFQSSQEQNAATIVYRMLVYLKYCFSGLAFPPGHGVLSARRLPSLRRELVQFLLEKSNQRNPEVTASFERQTGVYPNLFHLLRFDTEATLEVLRLAFPEDSNSDTGAKSLMDEKENAEDTEDLNLIVQETVNTLALALDMSNSDENGTSGTFNLEDKEIWPSKKDLRHLLEFIAHFVACNRATITKSVLTDILDFLTSENNSNQKIEESKRREKQMLTILIMVSETDWNSSYVLHICEKAHYHQVCGYIHTKRCEYIAALDSYIKDLDEPIHAFSFINSMFLHLRDTEFATFQSAVISRIPELVNLSREDTFLLIYDHFNKESENILSELRSNPTSLFLYLKATIEVHLSGTLKFSSLEKGYVMDLQSGSQLKDQPNAIQLYLEKIFEFPRLVQQNPVHITDDVIELYVELSCQYERNSVLKFLQTFDNYRLERCLRLCQEYRVIDAAAFLLERVGDVGSALSLTLSGLNEKFYKLDLAVENIVMDISMSCSSEPQLYDSVLNIDEVNAVRDILHSSIGICQRNSKRLDPEESEILWFQLLDSFCEPLRDPNDDKVVYDGNNSGTLAATFYVKEDKEASIGCWRIPKSHRGANILRKLLAQFIKEIVEGMIGGYVRLPSIMSKLLSDNSSQVFGDFKPIIMGLLGSYGFEKRILDTAKALIEDDTFYTMNLLKKAASHGYAPQNLICQICGCLLTKESSTSGSRVFECGHTTHVNCEIQENGLSNGNTAGCPVCVPKKKTHGCRNKSATTENRLITSPLSRPKDSQGTSTAQHIYDSDLAERPYGGQQISRFEVLSNLKKSQRSMLVESLPQLRLAPPAVYHEKIQKGPSVMIGESSNTRTKTEKPSRQIKELKMKKSALSFPLKSSIFGNEMTRKR